MTSQQKPPSVDNVATMLQYMGYHLQADVNHDFGTLPTTVPAYNLNGAEAIGKLTKSSAPKIDEESCLDFFLKNDDVNIIKDRKARRANELIFVMPDKTVSFKEWSPPVLYPAGNGKIGIVQDAGEFITKRLGAQNVITFGSILDPAGKPIDKAAAPIWYNPGSGKNSLIIPLKPFGFDTTIIDTITISNLTAGTVSATFDPGNWDAVSMKSPAGAKLGVKPINNTAIEKAGFFTSINKAEEVGQKKSGGEDLKYFYIGKTLGDKMLVASAMPQLYDSKFQPNISNVFIGNNTDNWKDWITGSNVPAADVPNILMLKTGDRLNWLRAIIFDVGAIYEDQAKKGRSVKQYRYFPGKTDPGTIMASILGDYETIKVNVINRYKKLADSIRALDVKNTSFAPGGMNVVTKNSEAAKALLARIANELIQYATPSTSSSQPASTMNVSGGVCKVVVDWITAQQTIAQQFTQLAELRLHYSDTLRKANACSPQVSSLLIEKKNHPSYFASKVIVAGVPLDIPANDKWPLQKSIDIVLRGAFSEINSGRVYTETDIDNRFFKMLPVPKPVPKSVPQPAAAPEVRRSQRTKGGGETEDAAAAELAMLQGLGYKPLDQTYIEETATEMVGAVPNQQVEQASVDVMVGEVPNQQVEQASVDVMVGGGQRGGVSNISVKLMNGMTNVPAQYYQLLETAGFSRIGDFLRYMEELGTIETVGKQLLLIFDVVRKQNSTKFHDEILLQELIDEFMHLCGIPTSPPPAPGPTAAGSGPVAAQASEITVEPTQYVRIVKGKTGEAYDFRTDILEEVPVVNDSMRVFNAYACNVDIQNSVALFGQYSASAIDFIYYERSYLDRLNYRNTRSGRKLKLNVSAQGAPRSKQPAAESAAESAATGPAAAGAGTGGGDLRTRRPLYSE